MSFDPIKPVQEATINAALALIDHPNREQFRSMVEDGAKGKQGAEMVADSIAKSILASRDVLDKFEEEHGRLLVPDRESLELEPASNVHDKLVARLKKQTAASTGEGII